MKKTIPDWFKKIAVYQINPRTFSGAGTINAVTEELPALAELGFGVMYLCPVFKEDDSADRKNWSTRQKASETQNPKNPYRINDYFSIDEEYGNMEDLKRFVEESHALGMKVFLDLVYLHIGPNADILKLHPEFAARNEDGSIKYTTWNFPYLNFECEGLREYLYCNMAYYAGVIDVDGFRCDVGDDVPLDFWREAKRRISSIKPDVVMINEGQKSEYLTVFDANYGFYWHGCIFELLKKEKNAADVICEYRKYLEEYPEGALILRDMDNHDTVTDWPYRIEEHFGSDCMELILALNYTIDGVPMVYCGNELADKAKLSMFANRFYPGKYEFTDRTASGGAVERRKAVLKTLNSLKAQEAALSSGKTEWMQMEAAYVLTFNRAAEKEKMTFAGNFSEDDVEISVNVSQILLANNVKYQEGVLRIGKYGYAIIRG